MITLSTPSDILIRELETDMEKVNWWIDKIRVSKANSKPTRMLLKSYFDINDGSKHSFSGEHREYISKNGNKWCLYDLIFNSDGKPYVAIHPFVFWETIGSMGAILPTKNFVYRDRLGCMIFTGHFFQRYCERRKIPFEGKKTVIDFMGGFAYISRMEDKERGSIIFKANRNGYCYGVARKDNKEIVEVRTYIEDSTMSQRKREGYGVIDHDSFIEGIEEYARMANY